MICRGGLTVTVEIRVLYEDNHLLVVEKPANMLTQGDKTGDADLLSILKQKLKEKYQKPGNVYLGLVHRLDRPTGGALVLAKTSKAAARLAAQLREHTFNRAYLAVVHGRLPSERGKLEHYLRKDRRTNTVTVVKSSSAGAKKAKLTYQVLGSVSSYSLLYVQLETGRAHQIRVQLAAAGYPLFGDQRYGQKVNRPGQQLALWSCRLSFLHPTRKREVNFFSFPPHTYPWTLFASESLLKDMIQ
ncbi:MAG: RNA pseudouridine synthase [Firmicutes bacterium]|jgi:23S rRNA pseudouridine1911/1915/1917 synthase|nr:RNA pseudouridine synthase [Bacillota bacterium]